jgi:putative hydrolase of the HAD superfamily
MLSFEFGAMKPAASFFQAAAKTAGVSPTRIFFVDDRPEHVQGAVDCGFDAVRFTTADALAAELDRRGVRMNY